MRKFIFTKPHLLLLFATITMMSVSNHHHCLPTQCTTTFPSGETFRSVIDFFIYDKQDRLIADSVNDPDTTYSINRTVHLRYQGDSIVSYGEYIAPLIIRTNRSGFPTFAAQPPAWYSSEDTFIPFYRTDGTIEQIKSTRVNGVGETWRTTIDSIIYSF